MISGNEYAIVVESLTKRYRDLLAVDAVSFRVRKGEVFAFVGPNGAGKTTTAEIIETIRTPTSGIVRVLGMNVTQRKRDIVRRIGVLPQGFSSFDRITVRESIRYYSRLFRSRPVDVDALMNLTNLRDKSDVQFNALSGGLKQRLGIAIALVNDPEIVFLDEPTTGLDPRARRAVWDVLRGLKEKGTTVFLTTHYLEEAELLADTVAVISKGHIIALDSPDELITRHAPFLSMTFRSADKAVLGVIRGMSFEPTQDVYNVIKVRVRRTEDVQDILQAIDDAGLSADGLEVRRPSLEDVFVSLTAEEPRAGDAKGEIAA